MWDFFNFFVKIIREFAGSLRHSGGQHIALRRGGREHHPRIPFRIFKTENFLFLLTRVSVLPYNVDTLSDIPHRFPFNERRLKLYAQRRVGLGSVLDAVEQHDGGQTTGFI